MEKLYSSSGWTDIFISLPCMVLFCGRTYLEASTQQAQGSVCLGDHILKECIPGQILSLVEGCWHGAWSGIPFFFSCHESETHFEPGALRTWHLSGLKSKHVHLSSHAAIWSRSYWSVRLRWSWSVVVLWQAVSVENSLQVELVRWGRSLAYRKKRLGPRTEPCDNAVMLLFT